MHALGSQQEAEAVGNGALSASLCHARCPASRCTRVGGRHTTQRVSVCRQTGWLPEYCRPQLTVGLCAILSSPAMHCLGRRLPCKAPSTLHGRERGLFDQREKHPSPRAPMAVSFGRTTAPNPRIRNPQPFSPKMAKVYWLRIKNCQPVQFCPKWSKCTSQPVHFDHFGRKHTRWQFCILSRYIWAIFG